MIPTECSDADPTQRRGQEVADAAAELVKRSCAAQGLPERLDDPGTIARVAVLLGEHVDDVLAS